MAKCHENLTQDSSVSYIQLCYYNIKMILQLTRSINPMNESLSKTWTETDMPLQTAITRVLHVQYMWLDFLESLANSKQLCCKHLKLILLLRRPHSKNKETLSGFGLKQP